MFLCLYRSVELYDSSEDKWSRGIPMPNRESFAGCAVLQSEVALLGGGLHGRSMTLYNPTAQSWRTAQAPHTPHLHSAVASMQDSLFVLVSSSAVINQSVNQSMFLMSWGATGTQQTRSSVRRIHTDKNCFLHAKHSLRTPPQAFDSHNVIKSAMVQQCCRRSKCCDLIWL